MTPNKLAFRSRQSQPRRFTVIPTALLLFLLCAGCASGRSGSFPFALIPSQPWDKFGITEISPGDFEVFVIDDDRTGIKVTGGAGFAAGAMIMPVTLTDLEIDATGSTFTINRIDVHVHSGNTAPTSAPGSPIETAQSLTVDYKEIEQSLLNDPALTHNSTLKYFTIWVVITGTDAGAAAVYDAKRVFHPTQWDPKEFIVTKRP